MFTKTLKALLLLSMLALSACGLKTNEDPPPPQVIDASLGFGTECFADSGVAMNDFFKGQSTKEQVDYFWNCISYSVSEFEKNTHGKDASRYTSRELANFFERYFIKDDSKISDDLMSEAFRLKSVFVGGDTVSISRPEMIKVVDMMGSLKKLTLAINPYMDIFSLRYKPDPNNMSAARVRFAQGEQELIAAAKSLSGLMQGTYTFDSFVRFAEELDVILPAPVSGDTTMGAKAHKYIPLLITFKNILFNDQDSMAGDDVRNWQSLLNVAARIFSQYAYYNHFLAGQNFENNVGAVSLYTLAMGTLDVYDNITIRKANHKISAEELASLGASLKTAELMPDSMTGEDGQKFFTLLTSKFTPNFLRSQIGTWYSNQMSQSIRSQLQDIFFDGNGRMSFSTANVSPSELVLFRSNLVASVAKTLFSVYTKTGSTVGLTEEEMNTLYLDFKPLMVGMKIVAANDYTFGADRFRDANIFTPKGNGDSIISVKEGTDLMLMLMSGMKRDELLRDGLSKACAVYTYSLFWGDNTTSTECARQYYLTTFNAEVSLMPGFLNYMNVLNPVQRLTVTDFSLTAAGAYEGRSPNARFIKLSQQPQVLQYVEVIFKRFDTNNDGILNAPEANIAWPIFKELMMKYSGVQGEALNHTVFGYMLRHGRPPEDTSEKIDFAINWQNKSPNNWSITADRARVLQVMGYIAQTVAAATPAPPPAVVNTPVPEINDPQTLPGKFGPIEINVF